MLSLRTFILLLSISGILSRENSKRLQNSSTFTKELDCQTIAGHVICNGTNEQYQNATLKLESEAQKLKTNIIDANTSISRSGYSPCSYGAHPGCTMLETIMVPTFLTNRNGQPRYIYQNKLSGIMQEIKFTACRKGPCHGGSGKCVSNERQYMLLSIDPYHPSGVFPDSFSVPGCCSCAPGRPRPDYGHGYNPHGHGYGQGYGGSPGYGGGPSGYGGKPDYETGYGKPQGPYGNYGPAPHKPYGGGAGGYEVGVEESYEDGKDYNIKEQVDSFSAGRKPQFQSVSKTRLLNDYSNTSSIS